MLQKLCWIRPLRLLKCQNDSLQEKLNSEAKEGKKKASSQSHQYIVVA